MCRHTLLLILLVIFLWAPSTTPIFAQPITSLPEVNPSAVRGDIVIAGGYVSYAIVEEAAAQFVAGGYPGRIANLPVGSSLDLYCWWNSDDIDLFGSRFEITADWRDACADNGLYPVQFTLGYDAVAVYVSEANDFLEDLTWEQLRILFSTARRWSDVNPAFPNEPVGFLVESGSSTLDVFIEEMFDGEDALVQSAPAMVFGDDDPQSRARGVASDPNWVTLFNVRDAADYAVGLRLVSINGVLPTPQAIAASTYPLSQPIYLYADRSALERRPQVAEFLNFLLSDLSSIVTTAGYLPPTVEVENVNRRAWLDALGI